MSYNKQFLFVGGPFDGCWPWVKYEEFDTPPKLWQIDDSPRRLVPLDGTVTAADTLVIRHTYRLMPWMAGGHGHHRWTYVAQTITDEQACDMLIDNYQPRRAP